MVTSEPCLRYSGLGTQESSSYAAFETSDESVEKPRVKVPGWSQSHNMNNNNDNKKKKKKKKNNSNNNNIINTKSYNYKNKNNENH